ncbi:DUF4386 domain-containing protein, partial [Nocardia sp. NPDC101769]
AALTISALATVISARPGLDDATVTAWAHGAFLAGGPAYAAGFGLMAAGLTLAGRSAGTMAHYLVWTAAVLVPVAAVSVLTVALPACAYLLPVVRFGGLLWMLAALPSITTGRRR